MKKVYLFMDLEASLNYAKDNIIGDKSFISNETIYSIDIDENKIDGDLIKYKAKKQDFEMPIIFNNISSILKDVMAGDLEAANRPEYRCLNFPQIKAALDWLVANNNLDSTLKSLLFTESWRLNFRDKPPLPKEFTTEKYIGDMAETLFPWLSEYFLDFFDPLKPYRSGVLTSCIGAGKSTISVLMNAYLSVLFALMHKPYKYYGYAPSTVFTLVYGGWSQKKASELLLEPLLNLLRSSPYFEQCRTWEDMIKANKLFYESNGPIDKIYWTRASPTSELMFSNGLNVKIVSSAGDILGQNIIAGTLSELAFFRENGWALDLNTDVLLEDGSKKKMSDIKIGDKLFHPEGKENEVIEIPFEKECDQYKIILDDGSEVLCSLAHNWKVSYRKDKNGNKLWDIVTTKFMLDNPHLEFEIPKI